MRPLAYIFLLFVFMASMGYAQDINHQLYRTFDGTFNNIQHPNWGSAGVPLTRLTHSAYADGMAEPNGKNRPNPRVISNEIFDQDGIEIGDPFRLNDLCWSFGQFIDHDLGLTSGTNEMFSVQVPQGDLWFDPYHIGTAMIPMTRSKYIEGSGLFPTNPREQINEITAFIDGSGIYGSNEEHADWLRTFEGGKLKASEGNLLPYNTVDGQFESEIDPNAPEMDNATRLESKLFVSGDIRANENPFLLAFHTLFTREHNRIVEIKAMEHPDWDDEMLYQYARKIVGGEIQNILFEEWLPNLGYILPDYEGYNPNLNPSVSNEFTGAAFRLGHTLLNSTLIRMTPQGELMDKQLKLREGFFTPSALRESNGIEPFLQGMITQQQQSLDTKVIDDVRNFLFGVPGQGGLDLVALNIQRGRERGLPDYNSIRQGLGMNPITSFDEINGDNFFQTMALTLLYRDVNNIDPWVGMLSEAKLPNTILGPTIYHIFDKTFTALRDGDRFYFENDPILHQKDKEYIRNMTLQKVILFNTSLEKVPENVFKQRNYNQICDYMTVSLEGRILNIDKNPLENFELHDNSKFTITNTDLDGRFNFHDLPACEFGQIELDKEKMRVKDGISTRDMIKIQKRILGLETMNYFEEVAADVDASGSISIRDIIKIRKVLLGIETQFGESDEYWQFIPLSMEQNILSKNAPVMDGAIQMEEMKQFSNERDFVLIKKGDVDGSWAVDYLNQPRSMTTLKMNHPITIGSGLFQIPFTLDRPLDWEGLEFEISIDDIDLEVVDVLPGNLPGLKDNHLYYNQNERTLTVSWINPKINFSNEEQSNEIIFYLIANAQPNLEIGPTAVSFNTATILPRVFEGEELIPYTIDLSIEYNSSAKLFTGVFPNPFHNETTIHLGNEKEDQAYFEIMDITGRIIYHEQRKIGPFEKWSFNRQMLSGTNSNGPLFVNISTDKGYHQSAKLVIIDK
jgi:hypothetical protein